jgi:glycosyltransferase involved in cell wall biosynthesis
MTKVYLPVICYNHTVLSHFMFSVMKLIFEGQKRGISFSMDCIYFESLIARARNAAAANFLGMRDCDYMMFIDSDISFEPESFFALLKSDQDVVSGLYPKKYINSTKIKLLSDKGPEMLGNNYESLCTDFATEINYKSDLKETEEVKYAATGFMLFKKRVFSQLARELPHIQYVNDIDGYSSYNNNVFYDFFPCKVNPKTKKYESEDYGFCEQWRSIGGKIHVNTTCTLTHHGWKGYAGNFNIQNKVFGPEKTT